MLLTKKLHLMGTSIKLNIEHPQADALLANLATQLVVYERRFSANDQRSELMQITKQAGNAAVKVNSDLYELIKIGKKISADSTNNLNIAIGPLVQTWRIGFADAQMPTETQINAVMPLTDPNAIILDDAKQTVFLQHHGMAIDLGCLAKGFITDLLVQYLDQFQPLSALLNLGGSNILVMGAAPNQRPFWKIGLQVPGDARGQYGLILNVNETAIVTSGIYERTLNVNGHQYHHLLDATSGYPLLTDVTSITIMAPNSLLGEIWTTALFGQSVATIMHKLDQLPDIEGILITRDKQVFISKGFVKQVKIVNPAFKYQVSYPK
ncbi:thiamine biosynthesis lipoprotein [Weissella beninensis]|uniref:FAD:protein FMN transferase n=1 Tax=Periweissella beninensis TaxID=504936 RepID=A0ABT0VFW8_9LACO|nr:FAD:protein FMN transferase [Periweissella beninensis]MBM7543882.1 thiamine biosynthesis lipoprotein [Periweissella beninensis]MCM2436737.1 FAD:protein FMN transferase [Periweissella beninensis]